MSVKVKKYNKKNEYTYTLGVYPTLDLLRDFPELVLKVLISADGNKNEGVQEIRRICEKRGIPIEYSQKSLNRIAVKENTYAVGIFKKFTKKLDANRDHVVLVKPSDSGNLGTIIRSMVGFGFKDLAIIRPGVDAFDPKVVRSTMGALFNVNFRYYDSFEEYLKEFGNHTIYTFMLDGAEDITKISFSKPYSLVFGNESTGLDPYFKKKGKSVYIPHSKDIDSLNLSVAASIGMFYSRERISTH